MKIRIRFDLTFFPTDGGQIEVRLLGKMCCQALPRKGDYIDIGNQVGSLILEDLVVNDVYHVLEDKVLSPEIWCTTDEDTIFPEDLPQITSWTMVNLEKWLAEEFEPAARTIGFCRLGK